MDEDDPMHEDDPELDCPFSGSLGLWEYILAGELDRCSSTREEVMVLDVHSFLIHGDVNNTTALIQQGLF